MMARRDVIPIREAQKAVWELWEFVWQALMDPDGSHTTHFATAALIKERAIEIKDKLATPHDGGCLYRLKSNDYSLDYWRGALEEAFKECEQIERALGLPPGVHTSIYTRLKQWESLLNRLEEVRDDA